MQEDQDNNSLSSKSLIALIALDKEAFLKAGWKSDVFCSWSEGLWKTKPEVNTCEYATATAAKQQETVNIMVPS